MHAVTTLDCSRIAQDLQIRKVQVEAVVQLLDEGNTVPFITRYRKERTGGLNEEVIRQIQSRIHFLRQLADRKQTILKSIDGQGRLTDELKKAIVGADTTRKLEDLYLPYKPKKRSLANAAREKGLDPLAWAIWYSDSAVDGKLDDFLPVLIDPDKGLNTPEEVRLGVQHIIAEMIAETAEVRATVRHLLWETGEVQATKSDKVPEGQGVEYKGYFQFKEAARQIPPHRILALNRGEKEGILKVKLEWAAERVHHAARVALADHLLKVAGKMPALPTPPAPPVEPTPNHAPEATTSAPEHEAASTGEQHPPVEAPHVEAPIAAEPVVAPINESPEIPATPLTPEAAPLVAGLTPNEAKPIVLTGEPLIAESEFRSPHAAYLLEVFEDAMTRLLLPSLEREIRHELTDEAESHAVAVFARNLKSLLLQPPLRGKRVLAVDPGFRTGCKLAILDEIGNLIEHTVVYPFGGNKKGKRGAEGGKKDEETADVVAQPTEPSAPEAESTPTQTVATETNPATETVPPVPPSEPAVELTPASETTPTENSAPEQSVAESQQVPDVPAEPVAQSPAPDRRQEAKDRLQQLIHEHRLDVVALGNGTGCRETEEMIADLISLALPELAYVIVNEAGASVYSVSQVAREEFPDYDATTRSAISIGRRLQDPLSELVKIDPQSIGVGLYQHDVGRKELRETLESIVESCVNQVGVDLNTASVPLLRYVSGLNQMVAREVVEHRKQHGPITSREQLMQIQGMGPTRYQQAAGFLKIPTGVNPFDRTWIHPESYPLTEKLLAELGFTSAVLEDKTVQEDFHTKLRSINVEEMARQLGAGLPTIQDIIQSLLKPGRDPREDLPPPIFKKGILKIDDLQPEMELKGTVLNVVDFGAFVDVGLKDSGLVHISQIANRYIKSPYDVVAVNDVVTVWVLSVDKDRHHVSLTMIKPGTERKPEQRPKQSRQSRPPRGRRPEQGQGQNNQQPAGTGQASQATSAVPAQQQGDRQGGGDRRGGGNRPPQRGRGPNQGQGQGQGQNQSHGQGGQGQGQRGDRRPQHGGSQGGRSNTPPPPPPPPRKPRREPPRPKLTQDAIEGKIPLRTFSELNALFQAKKKPAEESPPASSPDVKSSDIVIHPPSEITPNEPSSGTSASSS